MTSVGLGKTTRNGILNLAVVDHIIRIFWQRCCFQQICAAAALLLALKIMALLCRGFHDHPNRLLLAFEAKGTATVSKTRVMGDVVMGAIIAACRLVGAAGIGATAAQLSTFRQPRPSMQLCMIRTLALVTTPSAPL